MSLIFNKYIVLIVGLLITFAAMIARSLYDDHGYHIEVEELEGEGKA
ncbi:cytochrome c oxidase, subunit I [Paenibacillus vortex V453]|nr:cytochrome c oxidase, subunit I [Paenibacillus vortex V453]